MSSGKKLKKIKALRPTFLQSTRQANADLTENTFSPLGNEVFAALYPEEFYKMLEKISNRRITNAPPEQKITVNSTLFNEMTEIAKYSPESIFIRSHE